MTHGSLFSGIGGFDLAAEWCGWHNLFQVEIDGFCQKVLEKNFPNTKRYKDIYEFDGTKYRGAVDVVSGGFPCQPFSVAGKRRGAADDRALWPEMLRVISEVRPAWVVGENVTGIVSMELESVCASLEALGYEVQPIIIPACAVGAPHRRDRVWIIAYSESNRNRRKQNDNRNTRVQPDSKRWQRMGEQFRDINPHAADAESTVSKCAGDTWPGRSGFTNNHCHATDAEGGKSWEPSKRKRREDFSRGSWQTSWVEVATALCGVDDGIPGRVDRLKSLGNAIVPQVAYEIFKTIEYIGENTKT